jgi:peptidoglycan L-alanyl-D-glutamate endopeptidase CwlK
MDIITQQRIDELEPVFGARLAAMIVDCANEGIYVRIVQGFRSPNLQHAFYLQGREPLDVVNEARQSVALAPITDEDNQKTVTNADWMQSMHCFGLAGDGDPSLDGTTQPFNPDWSNNPTQDPKWERVLAIAATHKLAEGANWTATKRDYPHFYPLELAANPTEEMIATFKAAGVKGVWKELNLQP